MPPYHQLSSSAGKPPGGTIGWGKVLPIETCRPSAPSSSHHLQTWMYSSRVLPFFSQGKRLLFASKAFILTGRWKSVPPSRRMDRIPSRRKRKRFSSEPPYSSFRSLIAEERNWVKR